MQRNLGSEVLVAVGGLGIIICGLLFALLLSDDTDIGVPTMTNTVVSTETSSQTEAPGGTATPSETATETEEPVTEIAEVSSPEPTDTKEATPTETETEESDPSDTPTEKPSRTPRAELTDTEIPTETKVPDPSDTPTEEPDPSDTPTEKPTTTDTPPTMTEDINLDNATATSTSVTGFTGIIPTLPPSPTVFPADAPTRTPASCELPRGWTTYRVLPGDTLFAISLVTNSTVDELKFANCIDDIDNITSGDRIFVPVAPLHPVSTAVPSGIRVGLASVGCTSPATQITSPVTAQRVSGSFTVFGTATRPDFQYYKIEVRPDFADIYNFYSDSRTEVVNGQLGQINADLFGPGLHWVRLSVVNLRAEIPADAICEIPVIFE